MTAQNENNKGFQRVDLNTVSISGNLTKDPNIKSHKKKGDGEEFKVAYFTVATNRGFGDNRQASFVSCKSVRNMGLFEKVLKKGSYVALSGHIETFQREGEGGGTVMLVNAQNVVLPPRQNGQGSEGQQQQQKGSQTQAQNDSNDDSNLDVEGVEGLEDFDEEEISEDDVPF